MANKLTLPAYLINNQVHRERIPRRMYGMFIIDSSIEKGIVGQKVRRPDSNLLCTRKWPIHCKRALPSG